MASNDKRRSLILISMFLPFCWLAMMILHEAGHVIAAWLSGGTVTEVVLHPLAISRTDVSPNPHPTFVVWAGPVAGCLFPLVIWVSVRSVRLPEEFLARFLTGFCLVANGAYIGVGAFERIGDAGTMLQHGSPTALLWCFGLITVPAGFAVWNGQGRQFGFGIEGQAVTPRAVAVIAVLLCATLILEVALTPTH